MKLLAKKEIYRLDINVGVTGDTEAKTKLTATEKMAEQTKKKMQALDKIRASPTAKLNDQASSKLDKLDSKMNNFKSAKMTVTAKIKDEASSTVDKIENKTKKIKEANILVKAKDEASGTITKIESKINGWIKAGAKKVIAIGMAGILATGGIGIGTSIKTFAEYEKGLSNVRAVTDATDAQMKQLGNTAKTLGESTSWDAVQVTQAEELLGQAGFSVGETITALPGLLSLASAGGLDLAAATDIASGTLRAFNLSASDSGHVADVLALSASATNSDVTDLGESMKYCAPVSQALGISLEDTAAATGLLSNANIKGSSAGTILRQTMARLASPTKEAAGMMKQYGINAFDAQGNMKPLNGVVDNLKNSLGKLTSQQRADVISTIFGTESMSGVLALMNQGGQSVSDLSERLKGAKGAADKMAETKLDNLSGQWEQLTGAVQTAQINLGERLAPYAKEFVTWLTGKLPAITDKIMEIVDYVSKHTDDIKYLAITVASLGTAFMVLSTAGKIGNAFAGITSLVSVLKGAKVAEETAAIAGGLDKIGVIGKLLPALMTPAGLAIAGVAIVAGTAIVANNNLLKKSLSTTTEELGPVEKIMNELHGHIYKSKEEMQQLGLVYDDFGDSVGDDFKNKVKQSTKSIMDFQFYINKINLDGVITDSESSEFDNKVNEMCYSSIKTIEDNKAKSQESMKAMFLDDGLFSESEQATLEYLSKDYDIKITSEQTIRDDIYDIRKKAVEEHRKLNDEDLKNIKDYQSQMAQIELESAGGNKEELSYAKNKFKARAEGVDIKDGSALAQEASKDRDSRIVDVKATYDTNLDKLKLDLENAQSDPNPSQDTINKIKTSITENEQSRLEKISEINKLWDDKLDTLYKTNSKLKGKINKYDGTELKGKDIEDQNSLEKIKNKYSDLKGVTKEGFYGIKNDVTGVMSEIYVTVDENTKEITGAWNATTGETGAYTDEMKSKVQELATAHADTTGKAINSLLISQAYTETATGNIKNRFGDLIGTMQNVKTAEDGTVTGILDLNGTPIQITSNAEGAILSINEVEKVISNIPRHVDVTISAAAQGFEKIGVATINSANTIAQNAINKKNSNGYATGTENATAGIHPVAENGFEIVTKKQNKLFSGGEKVLNHEQSKAFLKNQQNNDPFQVKQGQYKVFQPQMQVAGTGGVRIGDIQVNVNGSQDSDGIVQEIVEVVGYKLKEALINIKK